MSLAPRGRDRVRLGSNDSCVRPRWGTAATPLAALSALLALTAGCSSNPQPQSPPPARGADRDDRTADDGRVRLARRSSRSVSPSKSRAATIRHVDRDLRKRRRPRPQRRDAREDRRLAPAREPAAAAGRRRAIGREARAIQDPAADHERRRAIGTRRSTSRPRTGEEDRARGRRQRREHEAHLRCR